MDGFLLSSYNTIIDNAADMDMLTLTYRDALYKSFPMLNREVICGFVRACSEVGSKRFNCLDFPRDDFISPTEYVTFKYMIISALINMVKDIMRNEHNVIMSEKEQHELQNDLSDMVDIYINKMCTMCAVQFTEVAKMLYYIKQ